MNGGGVEIAYAKLNLALHVRRREADGYHALETLFAFCEDGDRLTLDDAPGLRVTGPFAAGLAGEGDNLVLRAARAFAAAFGGAAPGFVLDKRLPVAAGIGGGSADAAAALRLLCRRDGIARDDPRLDAIAASLGADVPACLRSVLTRGEGRGDRLRPLDASLGGMPALLVNPNVPLATGAVFGGWDGIDRGPLADGDPLLAARAGRNDLEPAARALVPAVAEAVALLGAQRGTTVARMSGSGATCFALFDAPDRRDAAAAAVARGRPEWWRLATALRG